MAGFDECCPHCGAKQDIRSKWESADYASDFVFVCDCGKNVQVIVHQIPEFETKKVTCYRCRNEVSEEGYCPACLKVIHDIIDKNAVKFGESNP